MKLVCEKNKCTGCMACIDICQKNAIIIHDTMDAYNAVIDKDKCINCGMCHQICQNNSPVSVKKPEEWYQGWAENNEIRRKGASGGLAMAIAGSFINQGGVVCSCVFESGKFIFKLVDSVYDLQQFAGSKYVKSNPMGIYRAIKDQLKSKKKVLFIGLPCQVAAVRNYMGERIGKQLYTVDLICHGTPSPKVLEKFLSQYQQSLEKIEDIKFRIKGKFQIYEGYKGIITTGVCDRYMIAFLNALTYTENCYECQYAKKERVSDLTLGDSWGSQIKREERAKGISLVLSQSEKGIELLKMADLRLRSVSLEQAIENNQQLCCPSLQPEKWDEFFGKLKKGKRFNRLVEKYLPRNCLKQDIKRIMIKMHLYSSGAYKLNYGISMKQ